MIPAPAQYLLRFDDLCPTMDRSRWQRFLPPIERFGIRPILAVVPDNRDPDLAVAAHDPNFWVEMRALQAAGAAIGLHGYRHLCLIEGRSLLPLQPMSEFAGVTADRQREWIRAGLKILRSEGLMPRVWVAPRHGFDGGTLHVLRQEGIAALSDGFARGPVFRNGVIWVPQQLWEPEEKTRGLWTICIHSNTASQSLVAHLEAFLARHHRQFTSLDRVLTELSPARLSLLEQLREKIALQRILFRHRRLEGSAGQGIAPNLRALG